MGETWYFEGRNLAQQETLMRHDLQSDFCALSIGNTWVRPPFWFWERRKTFIRTKKPQLMCKKECELFKKAVMDSSDIKQTSIKTYQLSYERHFF